MLVIYELNKAGANFKVPTPHPRFYCTYILSQNLFYAFKLGTFHNKTGFWCKASIKGPVLKALKHIDSYQAARIHNSFMCVTKSR